MCASPSGEPPGRVLVVEDEVLVAMDLEALLTEAGYEVLGPAPSVSCALRLLEAATPRAALLDLNLAGRTSAPVADALRRLGVPFLVVTGYSDARLEAPNLRDVPLIRKPYDPDQLLRRLHAAMA